jgi:hypothetical protein
MTEFKGRGSANDMTAKELRQAHAESGRVATVPEEVGKFCDFPEVWQPQGLEVEAGKLESGAFTGETGWATISPNMQVL